MRDTLLPQGEGQVAELMFTGPVCLKEGTRTTPLYGSTQRSIFHGFKILIHRMFTSQEHQAMGRAGPGYCCVVLITLPLTSEYMTEDN